MSDEGKESALNALERALTYPYSRPPYSFTFEKGEITQIPKDPDETAWSYAKDRTAVLAYGSNASPEQLTRKFTDKGKDPIHVLRCVLRGWDVVYSGFISSYGSVPATMVPHTKKDGEKSPRVYASLLLLTKAQFSTLDKSEKPKYDSVVMKEKSRTKLMLLDFPAHRGERYPGKVHAYICPLVAHIDKKPVALTDVHADHRHLKDMTQKEIQQAFLSKLEKEEAGDTTLADFILDNAEEEDIRESRNKKLEEMEIAKKIEHDDELYTVKESKGEDDEKEGKSK